MEPKPHEQVGEWRRALTSERAGEAVGQAPREPAHQSL